MSLFYESASLGQYGSLTKNTYTTTATPVAGKVWVAIQVVSDTRFHTLTNAVNDGNGDSIANTTLASASLIPAGVVLYGKFTSFRIHQGAVVAYYGS